MKFTILSPQSILALASALRPFMRESAVRSRGRVSVEDLLGMALNGRMLLWVVSDGVKIHGYAMTETREYPQTKMLVVQYCAMKPGTLEDVDDVMQATLEKFAKVAGCAGIEFVGRPGWRAVARKYGYESESVVYQKVLE